MHIIVSLGNPGKAYVGTRHNVGVTFLEYLADFHGIEFDFRDSLASFGTGTIDGADVTLCKTSTYMNNSGSAVSYLLRKFKKTSSNLLVIHDDMDLPIAKLRIKANGSSGGHKGIDSVIDSIGTPTFHRLRIGIGRPEKEDEVKYVLGLFSKKEVKILENSQALIAKAVSSIVNDGIDSAMNQFN